MVTIDRTREHGLLPIFTQPPATRSLLDVLATTVEHHGDRVALDAEDATLTYNDLSHAADELATSLREAGVGTGDRVGVRIASGTSELYVGILGVLLAGAAYVPVDADDPPARAAGIWEQAGVRGVLEDGLRFTPLAWVSASVARDRALGVHAPRALTVEDDAWVIFTSGSTGQPKGVAVSHGSATAFIEAEARLWSGGPRGPRPGRPLGRFRRELRGDVACVEQRCRARARATLAGPLGRRPRDVAGRARRECRSRRSPRSRRCGTRRRSRACAC